ncbi:MAG: MBL fold metallo-hydrolase [Candidatus Cloacimonetes bacterium]|jgi:hydroxyacylglutathione hydrolase|nr:MBL fold metallo-hydrolase [Candidatus Cloacimonadota bacterium]
MIVRRFYDDKLAQASWLVGCGASGEALVVDPNRDIDQYLRAAEEEGVRITHVTETHIHADFVSGSRELASRTGAQLYLSGEGGPDWSYGYAEAAGAVLVRDGDTFNVGNVSIRVMHTPGHTPEHIVFIVTDGAAADLPMGVLTGDFVFVGDVGRPDLLERAAGFAGTMEAGARDLYRSLQRFRSELPDFVQLWPGHGAGSACGKALGAVPQSTLGYEKLFNIGLAEQDEATFIRTILAGQPEPPKYFAEMKRINRDGPRVLGGFRLPPRQPEHAVESLIERGAVVVDTRPAAAFGAGHIPGTINIPHNRSFTTWAGWLVPYDREFYLIIDGSSAASVESAVRDLAMIGLDRIAGWFDTGVIDAWRAQGRQTGSIPSVDLGHVENVLQDGSAHVIDVRGSAEWEAGHLPGVPNIPVGYLADRLDEIPRDRPVVLHCQTGGRSAIAASVLKANGISNVVNYAGGFAEWRASGRPVERATDAVGATA